MALNFPGPYTAELEYLWSGLTHTAAFNVRVTGDPPAGTAMSAIMCTNAAGSNVLLEPLLDSFMTLYSDFFNEDTGFISWTLWKNVPLSFERNFISASTPDPAVGTITASENIAGGQVVLSFRTSEGGIAKVTMLEGVTGGNTQEPLLLTGGTVFSALASFMVSPSSPFIGRDTSLIVAPLRISRGENERVWRKRFR